MTATTTKTAKPAAKKVARKAPAVKQVAMNPASVVLPDAPKSEITDALSTILGPENANGIPEALEREIDPAGPKNTAAKKGAEKKAEANRTKAEAAAKTAAKSEPVAAPLTKKQKRAAKTALRHTISSAGLAGTIPTGNNKMSAYKGIPANGIDDYLLDQVTAKDGQLHSVMCKKLGWQRCSRRLARAADIAGIAIVATKVGDDIRFTAAK